ncbi:MAG: acetate/propionate family kinase [Planctomycetota bacterium]
MNVLVVNIGSTSFKFRLLDMATERVLASGGVEGVGTATARATLAFAERAARAEPEAGTDASSIPDQSAAVAWCLAALAWRGIRLDAVGLKAVHGGDLPEAVRVTAEVLRIMEEYADVAPSHNPAYIAAMRAFQAQMPDTPLVAAFETGFHRTVPAARTTFAIPHAWTRDHGIRRYGFHGASHRYVAERTAELLGGSARPAGANGLRIISCHLGGSSSLCAIKDGRSIATSMGMTPQSGLPQNNRVGDFEAHALLRLKTRTGLDYEDLLARLAREGGLLGISGRNDMAEIVAVATNSSAGAAATDCTEHCQRARLAVDVYVESVRHYLGAYVVALGGLDALVFTGGIGEHSPEIRRRVCADLEFLGIELDPARNEQAQPDAIVSPDGARVAVLTVRTNEELIVARQTVAVLSERQPAVASGSSRRGTGESALT